MGRTDLQGRFAQIIREKQLFSTTDRVLVAVSTGVDSMTLWHLCQHLPKSLRPTLAMVYIDHHLRTQSQIETHYIRKLAQAEQAILYQADWTKAQHPCKGIEAAARVFRYDFFYQVMRQQHFNILVTAHHQDDLAETSLMKLVRSGDLQSVIGLNWQRPFHEFQLVRPLLEFSKQEIYQFAQSQQLTFFEDETNSNNDFFRNRLRHQVIPLLKKENPHFLDHMNYFTQSLRSTLQLRRATIEQLSTQLGLSLKQGCLQGSITKYQAIPKAEQLAVWQGIWDRFFPKVPISREQTDTILKIINQTKPQAEVYLEKKFRFKRRYNTFSVSKIIAENQTLGVSNPTGFKIELNHWRVLPDQSQIGVFNHLPEEPGHFVQVYLSPQQLPLIVRHRKPGDIYLLPKGHHGKLKKLLIDAHIPLEKRNSAWLVFSQAKLLWIPNFRLFQLFPPAETDKMELMLCFKENN